MKRIFSPFLTFIALFIGTGFISGSVVHMGEGINIWDLSLLAIGTILFVGGSVFQDAQQGMKRIQEEGLTAFLFLSLLLSIGIGMASGGMQHFVDTPSYSALLIPFGLGLGFFAFLLKERIRLSTKEWAVLVPAVCISVVVSSIALRAAGTSLPDALRQDHHTTQEELPSSGTSSASSAEPIDDGHGH